MRLHPDPFHVGLLVAYDENGALAARGYLDLDPATGKVRFINELTFEQIEAAKGVAAGSL